MENKVLEKDYYELAMDFMEFLKGNGFNLYWNFTNLLDELYPMISQINELVTKTPLWVSSENASNVFFNNLVLKTNHDEKKTVNFSISHFLDRMALAPTPVYARGVVVLVVPVIKLSLDFYREKTTPLIH